MLKLHLTTWERLALTGMVGNLEGINMALMFKAHKVLEVLDFTPEERLVAGMKQVGAAIQWDNANEYDLEFDDPEALNMLQFAAKAHRYSMAERANMLPLLEKLGLAADSPEPSPTRP